LPPRSPWLAVEAGADLVARQQLLHRAHETFFGGAADRRGESSSVRSVIAASWRRSQRAGVEPEASAGCTPHPLDASGLAERRTESGLEPAVPMLREMLGAHASDAHHLLIVTDTTGHLLWVEGDRVTRGLAERIELAPGALWSESAAGTNAMGTSLAVDHAVQVFSAEHVRAAVHGLTCSAAPLHDSRTGELMGSVDLTGPANTVHPHSLALVTAAAQAVGKILVPTSVVSGRAVRVHALGTDNATIELGDRRLTLSRRHSEIVVLLAAHERGLSAEQLALELFGERGKPVSARAELSRLRRLLGRELDADPYRLTSRVEADFLDVRRRIEEGRAASALERYPGPLLPHSEAPGVSELRRGLDSGVRGTVINAGDNTLLKRWLESAAGRDDLPGLQLLLRRQPGDPTLAMLGRHAARLRSEPH
jgi:transcriptional regulator of acetoin/glycerol metabolism